MRLATSILSLEKTVCFFYGLLRTLFNAAAVVVVVVTVGAVVIDQVTNINNGRLESQYDARRH